MNNMLNGNEPRAQTVIQVLWELGATLDENGRIGFDDTNPVLDETVLFTKPKNY